MSAKEFADTIDVSWTSEAILYRLITAEVLRGKDGASPTAAEADNLDETANLFRS
jgi:hypothetical protein